MEQGSVIDTPILTQEEEKELKDTMRSSKYQPEQKGSEPEQEEISSKLEFICNQDQDITLDWGFHNQFKEPFWENDLIPEVEEVPFVEEAVHFYNPLRESIALKKTKSTKSTGLIELDYYTILKNKNIIKEQKKFKLRDLLPKRKRESIRNSEKEQKYKIQNFESLNKLDKNSILKSILEDSQASMLSRLEKQVLSRICKNGMPSQYRRILWLRATGAYSMMSMKQNKNYYSDMKDQAHAKSNSHFHQIDLDIKRTFFDLKSNYAVELVQSLRNVLIAYVTRNPQIGYCQGMNFIVGKILTVFKTTQIADKLHRQKREAENQMIRPTELQAQSLIFSFANELPKENDEIDVEQKQLNQKDEDDAFWIFTMLAESILPVDYYSNMVGVITDQRIFYSLLQQKIPELEEHLVKVGFDPSLLAFQWFVCFFSYNFKTEVLVRIWDMFFLKGIKIIYRISLALLQLMKDELMNTEDFGEVFEILESYPRKIRDLKTLIQTASIQKFKVKTAYIEEQRKLMRPVVEAEIQEHLEMKKMIKAKLKKA